MLESQTKNKGNTSTTKSTKPSASKFVSKSSSIIANFIDKIKTERLTGNKTELNTINEVVNKEKIIEISATTKPEKSSNNKIDKSSNDFSEDKPSLGFLSTILDALEEKLDDTEENGNQIEDLDLTSTQILALLSGSITTEKPKIELIKNYEFENDLEIALRESKSLGDELRSLLDDIDY